MSQKHPTLGVFNMCSLWIITDWYNCNKTCIFQNRMQLLLPSPDDTPGFHCFQI